jgi:hypothetical protein
MGSATTQGRPPTRFNAAGRIAFRSGDSVGALIANFRSSIPSPSFPLFTLHWTPHSAQCKTRGRADRYSFLVRLFHPQLHTGLSRRTTTLFSRHGFNSWLCNRIRIVSRPTFGTNLRLTACSVTQPHCPPRLPLRRVATHHRDDPLPLVIFQQRSCPGSLAIIERTIQSFVFVPTPNFSHRLGRQPHIDRNLGSRLAILQLIKGESPQNNPNRLDATAQKFAELLLMRPGQTNVKPTIDSHNQVYAKHFYVEVFYKSCCTTTSLVRESSVIFSG